MTRRDNPTKNISHLEPDLAAALHAACNQAGLDSAGAQLIHHYANAVCLLPAERAVARIARDGELHTARTALHLTRWLTDVHSYPATAPLPGLEPIAVDASTVVTFWSYYPQSSAPGQLNSSHLGRLVRDLHRLPPPPIDLPQWQPLQSLRTLAASPTGEASLSPADHRFLMARIDEVQQELASLDWALGLGHIHGDAWAGNLLWDTSGPVAVPRLGDWDSACFGPLEVDLIPSWHAAVRYGRGPRWARAFAEAYGHDLSSWTGFSTLFVMRDLVQLAGPMRRATHDSVFAQALRQRLNGIKANDRGMWREF